MILSPLATGNGAFVVHSQLARGLLDYEVVPYSPYRTLFPPLLYSLGRSQPTDIIHTTPDYAIFHHRRNVPMVLTFHNYVLDDAFSEYGSCLQRLHWKTDLRWFHHLAVMRADLLTTVSHATAHLMKEDLGVTQPIHVIPNGVNEKLFTPELRKPDHKIKVLFSGNLSRRKGVDWLVPIAEQLPDHIDIYYTSGLRKGNELIDHPRLHALGSIAYADMPALYRDMDMMLFPTVREGFSLSVLEAMSCGLSVVGWDVSSLPEQIENGKGGFLCPLGDVDSLVEKVVSLAGDVLLRRKMGEFNRSRVIQHFTLNKMLERYAKLLSQLSCNQ